MTYTGPLLVSARAKGGLIRSRPRVRVDRSMADNDPPEDALGSLRRRVADARSQSASTEGPPTTPASLAMRFGGEFGAAIIVGALVGYGADYFLHSQPWGLVIGLGLGFVSGIVNVVRAAQSYSRSHPIDPNAPSVADDEEL